MGLPLEGIKVLELAQQIGSPFCTSMMADFGADVINIEPRNSPRLSILSGAHKELTTRIMRIMKETGLQETLVIMGGIIPDEDVPILKEMGVNKVFGPGTDTRTIVDFIKTNVGGRDNS